MLHFGDSEIFRDCLLWIGGREHFSISFHPVLPTRQETTLKSTASSSFPVLKRRKSLPACGSNQQESPWPCSGHMPSIGVALCRGETQCPSSGKEVIGTPVHENMLVGEDQDTATVNQGLYPATEKQPNSLYPQEQSLTAQTDAVPFPSLQPCSLH